MKKVISFVACALILAPLFAAADSIPLQTPLQAMTTLAALQAQINQKRNTVSCAALTSTPTVAANQPFILAWGSMNALESSASSTQAMWTPHGASTIVQSKPGLWKYSFTFYGADGSSASCAAYIRVTK